MLFVLVGCSKPTKTNGQGGNVNYADSALAFSLKIVETYFSEDTSFFKKTLMDTIYFLEYWEKPLPACSLSVTSLYNGIDYSGYTFDDYLNTYDPMVMTYLEYKDSIEIDSFKYWQPDENDYLFIGAKVKTGKTDFMWDDLLYFIVTRVSNVWKLKALSG
jgi:hypothetical protein